METRKNPKKPHDLSAALHQAEERFERLIGLSSEWYWEQDQDSRFTLVTGSTVGHGGIGPEKFVGTFRWDRGAVPVGDGGSWDPHKAALEARQPFTDFIFKRPDSKRGLRYISTSGQPVFDDQGRFRGYRGIAKDITETRRAQELLALEHAVNRCLAEADSLGAALKAAIRAVCETEGWACGRYLRVDEKAGVLRFGEAWSVPDARIELYLEESRAAVYGPGVGLVGLVWQSGQPLWVPDTSKDTRTMRKNLARESGLYGAIFFPVLSEGKTIGVLTFNSREVREPDERLLQAVRVIGSQIGQFVQRKQAEDAVRESEERFRSLTELSSDFYWETDAEHRLVQTRYDRKHQPVIPRGNRSGKRRWEVPSTHPDDAGWAAHRATLEAHLPFRDFELARIDENGVERHLSISGGPVFDAAGVFTGYRGVGKEITGRKRAEKLQALEHAVNRSLADVDSVTAAVRAVIRAVCETEGWECGRYFRWDERGGVLRFDDGWSVPVAAVEQFIEKSRDITYAPGVGLAGRVWQTVKPLWVPDVTRDARIATATLFRDTEMRGAFVFPVTSEAEGKPIGVLAFNSREVREPDERLLEAIRVIGSQIGQFLRRKQGEEELRRFRAAIDVSADLVLLADATSMVHVDANETACRALGYSREELLAMGPHDISSASREHLSQIYDRLIAGGVSEMSAEGRFRRKDGSRLDVELFRRAVPSAKGHVIVVVARDVGERKRADQLLKLEHTVTRSLAEADGVPGALKAAMQAVCETEGWECGRYLRVDERAGVLRVGEVWGIQTEAIQRFLESSRGVTYAPGAGLAGRVWQSGQPLWLADVGKDSRAAQSSLIKEIGLHGAVFFPMMVKDKMIGILAFNSREVREPEERLLEAMRVIGSQIGQFVQRKQAEADVRESEERFRSLTGLSSDTYWEQDDQFRFTSMTDTGSKGDDLRNFQRMGKRRWEESYVNMSQDDWATHIALLEAHKPFHDLELCWIEESGRKIWGSVSGEPVFDPSGAFKGYRGVGKDITERKRAEQLRALEHAVSSSLTNVDDASAGLQAAILAVCETEGWDCGRYFRVDEKAGVLRFADAWGVPDPGVERFIEGSRELTYRPDVGLSGQVWRSGQPLWSTDVGKDSRSSSGSSGTGPSHEIGLHGTFVFPVVSEGKTIGVLSFASRKPREPEELLLEAIHGIGSQIGQFVQRKQTEDMVRESEERFRSLTVLSSDLYWEQDEQFRFTAMSGTGSDRVNVRAFPLIGKKRWEQNYVNMTADQWADHIATLEAHKPFRDMELCRLDESGKKVWISISGEPVFGASGAFKGYRGVGKDITERKLDEERIQFLANHDALTSLPNRAMFGDVLNLAIQNARRYNRNFAVLFIDLDRFKNINDTLGHETGDKLLQEMGTRLTQTVRSSDVVARLGGDEFVVLVQEVSEAKQVEAVARKILSALVQPMAMQGQECRVTASIGICMYPAEGQDEQSLMKNADIAMYRAKEDGKNTYKFYSEEINIHSFERMALETSLRRGLERDEFFLHYQAKLDLKTRQITGVEALIRWQHPELGMVSPVQFIPLAEETGLIVPIGKWVLNTACAQCVAWQREGLPPLRMAVNLSARQFADEDLVKDIADALESTGLQPELLELELTESMVIQNPERAGKVLAEIKKMGPKLAIDDFGVGYSSLTHLKRFPIDTLKVDRSFIRDLPQDPEDKAITEAIIAMGRSLHLKVVAEGVETLEQQTFLQDHACDEMQGFFFSKPISGGEFAKLLRNHIRG